MVHAWPVLWLVLLALLCAAELGTHAGSHNGFLQSSRPQHSGNDALPGDGYVSWAGAVPVLHDADGVFTLVAMFLGQRGPAGTGILDRRAAYAYLASLTVPWSGAYAGYLLLNGLCWWGAAAAAFWFVRRRWQSDALALGTSFLVASGNGFVFMAGVPMSYLAAYGGVFLLLALAEWLDAFEPPARLSSWLVLGWGAGVAATIYFAHIPLMIFWWLYGMRRVPWRCLIGATLLTLAISAGWEAIGTRVVGLGFSTDNSAVASDSVFQWASHLLQPWPIVLTYVRGGPLAGSAAIRGTLLGAFPYPWWALAAAGFLVSSRQDREWALAVGLGGLLPAIVLLSLLPLPRVAYYMYPATCVLAARGALALSDLAARVMMRLSADTRRARCVALVSLALCLGSLALTSNLDLLGYPQLTTRFHLSAEHNW